MPASPHVSSQCHRLRKSFPEHPLPALSHISTRASIFFIDLHTYQISLEIRSHARPSHLVPSQILSFPICEALTAGMRMKRGERVYHLEDLTGQCTNFYKHQGRQPQLHHALEPRSMQISRGRDPGSSRSEGSAGRQEWKP